MPQPVLPPEDVVYTRTQSAGLYVLGALLGCSVALLLVALRMPAGGLAVALASGGYALLRLRTRTVVTATPRRIHVARTLGTISILHHDVARVALEKDLWSRDLVIVRRDGSEVRVPDLRDPAGAVAVLASLVRAAQRPAPPESELPRVFSASDLLAMSEPSQGPAGEIFPPRSDDEREAVQAKIGRKRGVRPVDLRLER